jgi:hypothetical protein
LFDVRSHLEKVNKIAIPKNRMWSILIERYNWVDLQISNVRSTKMSHLKFERQCTCILWLRHFAFHFLYNFSISLVYNSVLIV